MSNPKTADPVRLTKAEVIGRLAEGVYAEFPEQYVPDALGYVLDEWQKRAIRKLFIGSNAPKGATIHDWFPEKKARLSVKAGHGSGKCITNSDTIMLPNGERVTYGSLIGKYFPVYAVDEEYPDVPYLAVGEASDNGIRKVIKFHTKEGDFSVTENHPLLSERNNGRVWLAACELHPGDVLFSPRKPLHEFDSDPKWTGSVFSGFKKSEIISMSEWEAPTVAIYVPGYNTFVADHVHHNTFLSSIVAHTFLGLYIPSIVVATGPTGKQTSRQLWQYITTCYSKNIFKDDIEMFGTTMKYKPNPSQWFATWLTSKEPKSIEGFHGPEEGRNILWIVEEAKGVADAVFEAIQGALSHEHNYWYISSTCGTASGFFFDTFHSKADVWENESATYKDSSRISLDQIEKWAKQWGRNSSIFKARVLAEFPEEDDKILVPLSWCERAIRRAEDEDYNEAA